MKKLLSRLGSASRRDVFYDAIDDEQPIGEPPDSRSDVGHMMNVILTRGESGLGLVFDENNVVTKLVPGCAAAENGAIRVGDLLCAVDGVQIDSGDNVSSLFPMSETTFNLQLFRPSHPPSLANGENGAPFAGRRGAASAREHSGKFDPQRTLPVFQEVVWNEYCILFPDGSSVPFNETVRYSALTGYLRKREVVSEGRAEFALAHGEPQRGYWRHFFQLSMKQLRWFEEDPDVIAERQRLRPGMPLATRLREALSTFKAEHSQGKGVGAAAFLAAPCRLYVSRLYRNEFALSYGGGQLLVMQAGSGSDAKEWVVALASCLFFSSASFEAVLVECKRFFDAAHKTVEGRLAPIEALDLLRAMGREATYSQVAQVAEAVGISSAGIGWLGLREFTYLVRSVCAMADPRSELLRAFRLLDGKYGGASSARSGDGSGKGGDGTTTESVMSATDLLASMRTAGVPEEHVQTILRAAGADERPGERVRYAHLADVLYPAAATAAKRRRVLQQKKHAEEEAEEAETEQRARAAWERQRREIGVAERRKIALMAAAPAPAASGSEGRLAAEFGLNLSPLSLSAEPASGEMTPRQLQIFKSISSEALVSGPATPRTIADRVSRARKASAQAANKGQMVQGCRARARLSSTQSMAKEDMERQAQLETSPQSAALLSAAGAGASDEGAAGAGASDEGAAGGGVASTLRRI